MSSNSSSHSRINDFLGRQPFAAVGGASVLNVFVNLVAPVLTIPPALVMLSEAISALTHPLWNWLFDLIGFSIPILAADYLTVCSVIFFASVREFLDHQKRFPSATYTAQFLTINLISVRGDSPFFIPVGVAVAFAEAIVWPLSVFNQLRIYALTSGGRKNYKGQDGNYYFHESISVFFEFLVWAIFIVAFAYAIMLIA